MDIHEIVRLLRDGASDHEIRSLVGLNRRTVARYRHWATEQDLLVGPLPAVSALEARLQATLPVVLPPQQTSTVAAYQDEILALRQQGVEVAAIRARLEEAHGQPVSYSALWRLVHKLEGAQIPPAFVRVEVPPGVEAQVDFGYAGRTIDPATGHLRKTWVFVMVLAYSRHLYAELVFDQRVETWLLCHRHAFECFGGVPERIVLDNLKAAILYASVHEPVVQRAYRECAEHYGFRIDPNPPRQPHLKGKVEQGGVHYVKRNFLAGREPAPVDELNGKLRHWCTEVAGRRVHGTTKWRPLEQFTQVERVALRPLPSTAYDLAVWKQAVLHRDCHVVFEGSYYSAPHRLVGQTLTLRGGSRTVELFSPDHQRVATHPRASQPGERQTVPAHLPPHKLPGLVLDRETCRAQASSIGPATTQLVARLLDHRPEDRLKIAQRVLRLAAAYDPARLERACGRAEHFGTPEYPTLKRILADHLEAEPLPGQAARAPGTPARSFAFVRQAGEFAASVLAAALGRQPMSTLDLPTQLEPHLRRLRLSGILETLEVRTQQAIAEQWGYAEFLARLIQDEAERREHKRLELRLRRGQVNTTKTLEAFDFGFNPSINRQQVFDLATCGFIRQKRNVLLCGQTGTGKTHLVQALAHEAARQGFEVLYTTADALLRQLHAGRADGSTDKRLQSYLAPDLLVVDDFGLKPLPPTGAVDLYDVINGRYEQASIALTSNRAPEEFAEVWGDPLLANAGLDRLIHRATVLLLTGRSFRLAGRPAPSAAEDQR